MGQLIASLFASLLPVPAEDPEREARGILAEVKRNRKHKYDCEECARKALEDAKQELARIRRVSEAPPSPHKGEEQLSATG